MTSQRKLGTRWFFRGVAMYWAGLLSYTIAHPIRTFMRIKEEHGGHASLQINDALQAKITADGQVLWSASTTMPEIIAWIAIPPLVMWLLWLAWSARTRREGLVRAEERSVLPPGHPVDSTRRERRDRLSHREP